MKILGSDDEVANVIIPKATVPWNVAGVFSDEKYANLILASVSYNAMETVDIRKCFDDVTHIFAFGRNTERSVLSVRLLFFIGLKCSSSQKGMLTIKQLIDEYDKIRIYKRDTSSQITIDGETLNGFLVGMSVGDVEATTHSCSVTFTFIPDEER